MISAAAVQQFSFLGLLVAATVFLLWIVSEFLFPVFWAVVFAILLYPAYRALVARFGNPSLTSLITILLAISFILVPLTVLGTQLTQEAFALYQRFATEGTILALPASEAVRELLKWLGLATGAGVDLAIWAQRAAGWIFSEAASLTSATFSIIIKSILMLYLLFFFLRDGERLGAWLLEHLPLQKSSGYELFAQFSATVHAILKGVFLVAAIQGMLGGILFAIAGVENAVLWGAAMAFLSAVPLVGPVFIWLPVGLFILGGGYLWQGVLVLVGGAVLISPLDNILRPILVGNDTGMPSALVLVSILGGIVTFGIAGVVVGPVVAALALTVWNLFAREFKHTHSA